MKSVDDIYYNFWGKQQPKFTEMELALMEGGHSLENNNENSSTDTNDSVNGMQFIKGLLAKPLGR